MECVRDSAALAMAVRLGTNCRARPKNVSLQQSGVPERQMAGREGMRLWCHHLAEGVFQLSSALQGRQS